MNWVADSDYDKAQELVHGRCRTTLSNAWPAYLVRVLSLETGGESSVSEESGTLSLQEPTPVHTRYHNSWSLQA